MKNEAGPFIVLDRVKYPHNLAAAIRAAACFGATGVVWTGGRFSFLDGERLPREERMKGYADVEVVEFDRPFDKLPGDVVPVCVDLMPTAMPITYFEHPKQAAYVFGPEDGNVSQVFRRLCHYQIYIPAYHCLNLAAAINVVLSDRFLKEHREGLRQIGACTDVLKETRGEIAIPGWEGR